jgi:hypothetical protein
MKQSIRESLIFKGAAFAEAPRGVARDRFLPRVPVKYASLGIT